MHLVVNGWFWGRLATGSGQYLHELAQHLPQVAPEHRLSLVLPQAGRHEEAEGVPPGWQAVIASTPWDRVSDNLAKLWFEQISFPRTCRRLEADLALVPYWGSPWQEPCPTAVTVHDLIPLLLPAYRGGPLQQAYTALVSRTAGRADLVLTDSQASREDIVNHLGLPADRVHTVLLAAGDRFQPVADPAASEQIRVRYALPERFILYLGGFDVRKNVPRLVQAYAACLRKARAAASEELSAPDVPFLVIAGKLPEANTPFTPDPRLVVADAGIDDWVHFTGWIDEADKPALISLASLFAFPSLYEGYGLPVAEAVACGVPVLTSNRSSLPEAAAGGTFELVDPQDIDSIATGIARGLALQATPGPTARRTWIQVARQTADLLFKEAL